jgi:hypothetical protein
MNVDRGWVVTICLSLGAAAVVFGLPAAWPQPVADGPVDPGAALPQLRQAAAAVDAACGRGDVAEFAALTTAAHRRELDHSLQALDRQPDADTLRDLGRQGPLTGWLDGQPLAAHARAGRLVLALARADGGGAQMVAFVWDGRRWQFDGAHQAPAVTTVAAARAAVQLAVAERR